MNGYILMFFYTNEFVVRVGVSNFQITKVYSSTLLELGLQGGG